jgi:hypothetical protein
MTITGTTLDGRSYTIGDDDVAALQQYGRDVAAQTIVDVHDVNVDACYWTTYYVEITEEAELTVELRTELEDNAHVDPRYVATVRDALDDVAHAAWSAELQRAGIDADALLVQGADTFR